MRQYIALSGIRHVLAEKGTIHRTLRDSLNHPNAFFKRLDPVFDTRDNDYQSRRDVEAVDFSAASTASASILQYKY